MGYSLLKLVSMLSMIISYNALYILDSLYKTKHQNIRIYNSSSNDDKKVTNSNRPPIIPFDFARDDIIIPYEKTDTKSQKNEKNTNIKNNNQPLLNTYDPRPTGYNTPDDGDEVDENLIIDSNSNRNNSIDEGIVKLFKDIYIGSPYDSKNKKQARYVITNITVISLLIGIVFTAVWYIFPGKFISYRGDTDFTSRYADTTFNYIEQPTNDVFTTPTTTDNDYNNIINNPTTTTNNNNPTTTTTYNNNNKEYFDDAIGLPPKEITRFAPQPPNSFIKLAPGRTIDL